MKSMVGRMAVPAMLVMAPGTVLSQGGGGPGSGGHGMGFGGAHMGMGFGSLFTILLWGGLIVLAVIIVRSFWPRSGDIRPSAAESRKSAMEILEQRYANGEIDQEEFEQRRRALEGSGRNPS